MNTLPSPASDAPHPVGRRGSLTIESLTIGCLLVAELYWIGLTRFGHGLGVVAGVSWTVGIWLLLATRRWSNRDKTIGLTGLGSGYLVGFVVFSSFARMDACHSNLFDPRRATHYRDYVCAGPPMWVHLVALAALLAYIAFNVYSTWRLIRRSGRARTHQWEVEG